MEMKTSEAQEITRRALGLAIVKNRDKIIALLKKYGVPMDKSYTDDELIVAVLVGIRSNDRFKKDLGALLTDTTRETVSFTGDYDGFFFTGGKEFFNAMGAGAADTDAGSGLSGAAASTSTSSPSSSSSGKSALGQLFSDPKVLGNILNTGLTTLSNSLTNKSNQKLADTALAVETEKTKQAALLAGGSGLAGTGAAAGLSTGAKIAIGLAVAAVVGLVVWLVVRGKKK